MKGSISLLTWVLLLPGEDEGVNISPYLGAATEDLAICDSAAGVTDEGCD